MKHIILAVVILICIALCSFLNYHTGYKVGYKQAVEDNCFTVYPAGWSDIDNLTLK